MIKIRLWGLPEEMEPAIAAIDKEFNIHSQSSPYKDRQGDYVRVYLECDIRKTGKPRLSDECNIGYTNFK